MNIPEDTRESLQLLDRHLIAGRWSEALSLADELLPRSAGWPPYQRSQMWIARCHALVALDRLEEARTCLAPSGTIRLADRVGLWRSLGAQLSFLGLARAALRALDEAAALTPKDPDIQHRRARLLDEAGRGEEARAARQLALDFDPGEDHTDWLLKGQMLMGLERYEEAAVCFSRSLHLNPGEVYSISDQRQAERALRECEEKLAQGRPGRG